jgi:transcriptional regulator with XRE-family HTH domain
MVRPEKAVRGKPGIAGFGERLACVRQMRLMSQADLAQKTRLKSSAVSHFECGRRTPSAQNLRTLCLALNCSADYLIDSHDPCLTKFLGCNGRDKELSEAKDVFTVGKEYRVVSGSMGQSHTTLQFEGIPGGWNSVMFDIDIHRCPAIQNGYRKVFAAADKARARVSAMSREERAELEVRGREGMRVGRSNRKTR